MSLENKTKSEAEFKHSDTVLIRCLVLNSLGLANLLISAWVLLRLDFTIADDPRLWTYQERKWMLYTCWYNLVDLVYVPLSLYCDWKALRGEGRAPHVHSLNIMRHFIFTSIILPTNMFGGSFFWRLWNKDRELLAPTTVDQIVPYWSHHSIHTVTFVFNLVDLFITPRERPKSIKWNFVTMLAFLKIYESLVMWKYLYGDYTYPLMAVYTGVQMLILLVQVYVEHVVYFMAQWIVIDMMWGKRQTLKTL